MKNLLMVSILLFGGVACSTTGIPTLEQMSEADYSQWKLYIQLGVKIGTERLVQDHKVTQDELNVAAAAIDAIKGQSVLDNATSLITPALEKAGFHNDEVKLLLLVAENELISHGALHWMNPQTNVLELSPRTKEVLSIISSTLRNGQ